MTERAPGARLTALVAEDDKATRVLVIRILEREGFEVDNAGDGQDAIDLVRKKDYALIVLDLRMPSVDGYGVLRYIRQYRPTNLRRVVVTTALPPKEVAMYCEGDVCEILPKPFDIDDLARIAHECAADLESEVEA